MSKQIAAQAGTIFGRVSAAPPPQVASGSADRGYPRRPLRDRGGAVAAALVLALLTAGGVLVGTHFYTMAVARHPSVQEPAAVQQWVASSHLEDVTIESHDGLTLHAYYLPAQAPTSHTAVLAHGYGHSAAQMAPYAAFYHDTLGYNVLMPDARGWGMSEGSYIGFGWPERRDLAQWARWVAARVGADSTIVLHGVSMGAASVLMAAGDELPANVRAIVADCAYTSAKSELAYEFASHYHLPPFPVLPLASTVTRFRAGYTFGEASALGQVRRARVPVLFIHGAEDTMVPTAMAYTLYAACPTPKELWVVPGAGHAQSFSKAKSEYEGRVSGFLNRYAAYP